MATALHETPSAAIHRQLSHPVVDGDGHWLEPTPVYLEHLREAGGAAAVDRFVKWRQDATRFYDMTPEERQAKRVNRRLWWGAPAKPIDRATSMTPRLLHERLGDFGIDFAMVYPTLCTRFANLGDPDMRRVFMRAYNTMTMELFRPYADRLRPVALIPSHTPDEALEELDFAIGKLGFKGAMFNCNVARPLEGGKGYWIDSLGLDSAYDYDPVWQKFTDLKLAVTTHGGSLGWVNRTSPTSYVANHLGHFAQGNQTACRGLFMGGVTARFPQLRFAFLEGGIGWACTLYTDLIAHWQKRSRAAIQVMDPAKFDAAELGRILEEYGYSHATVEAILKDHVDPHEPYQQQSYLSERDRQGDDFWAVPINSVEDITKLFVERFYFGCEADDPTTAWAFEKSGKPAPRPIFSSDISHFDVPDMTLVLEEAWELVEDGLIDEAAFEQFTFSNAVRLHTAANPDFFKG